MVQIVGANWFDYGWVMNYMDKKIEKKQIMERERKNGMMHGDEKESFSIFTSEDRDNCRKGLCLNV